ncbi:hypothetical protein [Pseudoalteromonas citrea]|nr:hypothetical protein [Pseudoalteromonas citrea]
MKEFSKQCYHDWYVSSCWQNGPNFVIYLSLESYFYDDTLLDILEESVSNFLCKYPSPNYDETKYLATQSKLMKLENIDIDHNLIVDNNSWISDFLSSDEILSIYNSKEQWSNIFNTQRDLSQHIIKARAQRTPTHLYSFNLLILLASCYLPQKSNKEQGVCINTLPFRSNLRSWHLSQSNEQPTTTTNHKFDNQYRRHVEQYAHWIKMLQNEMVSADLEEYSQANLLLKSFISFTQIASQEFTNFCHESIKESQLAPSSLSVQKSFDFSDDTSQNTSSAQLNSYMWLLNIVYKLLPLLQMEPLDKQFLNYSLSHHPASNIEKMDALNEIVSAKF